MCFVYENRFSTLNAVPQEMIDITWESKCSDVHKGRTATREGEVVILFYFFPLCPIFETFFNLDMSIPDWNFSILNFGCTVSLLLVQEPPLISPSALLAVPNFSVLSSSASLLSPLRG